MGLNLAIIIGIKDYDTQQQLVACKKDADNMNALLLATGKYDDILLINGDRADSFELKDKLPVYINKYVGKQIDEILLYYSGHGGILDDEFIYIPSDYNPSKPNMTSYKNSEVDHQLRRLNPSLTVKVIDACHCGEHYVKDVDPYEKSIHSTKNEFHNCYFFFSSHDFQTSGTDDIMGYFTRSWFEAILSCKKSPIKYREIVDFIADKFQSNKRQKPYFVTQGTTLEEFCPKTQKITDTLTDIINGRVTSSVSSKDDADKPLLAAIKNEAVNYRTDEQICILLQDLKSELTTYTLNEDLSAIMDMRIEFAEGTSSFIKDNEVGEWLKNNRSGSYKATSKRSPIIEAIPQIRSIIDQKPIEQLFNSYPSLPRYYVSGFSVDIQLPYNVIKVNYISKFPNVDSYVGSISFIPSATDLRFFYCLSKNNGNFSTSSQALATLSCLYKDDKAVQEGLKKISDKFQQDILSDLNARFLDPSTGGEG